MKLGDLSLIRIYAKHDPYTDGHLAQVMETMLKMGAPIISVVEWRGDYFAIEGSHRLACAHELGLAPTLIITTPDFTGPEADEFWEETKRRLPAYSWLLETGPGHPTNSSRPQAEDAGGPGSKV